MAERNPAPTSRAHTHSGGSPGPNPVLLGTQTGCLLSSQTQTQGHSLCRCEVTCHRREAQLPGPHGRTHTQLAMAHTCWTLQAQGRCPLDWLPRVLSHHFPAAVRQASSAPGHRPVHTPTEQSSGLPSGQGRPRTKPPPYAMLPAPPASSHRRPSPGRQDPEL